jgi:outer membrane biosynthesis protein TonB
VNPFLRAHALPLVSSTLLHALALALVVSTAWLTVTPKITPPAAIDAYIAHPAARPPPPEPLAARPDPVELPAPQLPEPVAPPPLVDPKEVARTQAAELMRVQREAKQQQQLAAKRAAANAQKREAAAADKARKADASQRAARESDLKSQLDAEEHRLGAENAGLLGRYISELQARIERAWNRPPSAHTGLSCIVNVTQVPGGTVTDVKLGGCNGDSAVQQSIVLAVYRASPLPAPPDPSLFDRHLRLEFVPHE